MAFMGLEILDANICMDNMVKGASICHLVPIKYNKLPSVTYQGSATSISKLASDFVTQTLSWSQ